MALTNLDSILIKPIITEKSLLEQEQGKYSFWVGPDASKYQVASAFEGMFNLKPLRVNVINLKGKTKTNWKTRQPVVKSNRKKAIITVDKKQKIDLLTLKNK